MSPSATSAVPPREDPTDRLLQVGNLHRGLGFGFCYVDLLYQRAREETEAMTKRREGGEKGRKEKERRVHNVRPKAEQSGGVIWRIG